MIKKRIHYIFIGIIVLFLAVSISSCASTRKGGNCNCPGMAF